MGSLTALLRPTSSRKLLVTLLFLGVLLSASAGLAEDQADRTSFPADLAFNRGLYKAEPLKQAVARGIADEIHVRNDHGEIRHLWINVLENSRQNATEQTTLFVLTTSVFHSTLTESRVLQQVRLEYVVLDAVGRPAFPESEVLVIDHQYDESKKEWYWQKQRLKGEPVRKFYARLPGWARDKLCQASGFLEGNPGRPLVPYAPSDADTFLGVLDIALSIVPGVAKSVAGKVVEKVVKKASLEALKGALRDKSVRTGLGADISDERAMEFADKFRQEGKRIWEPAEK